MCHHFQIDMPRMTVTSLPYTDYYLIIRSARNCEWQRKWEKSTSKLQYTKPCIGESISAHNTCRQYEVKLSRLCIGHTRLTHEHLMSRINQQPTCKNAACGNQSLTIKHCLQECPQWRDSRVKYNIQGDIRTLLGKDCEVEQMMKFLKEIGKFEEI